MKFKAAFAAAFAAMIGSAAADEFKIVVPFAPGGSDAIIRPMLTDLGQILGQSVIIENRGGAGGILGATIVANAKPDGNTVLMGTMGSVVIAALINGKTTYHPVNSFETIALIGRTQLALVVRNSLEVYNLADLVKLAKGGAKLNFGSAGTGTSTQLAIELLKIEAGIEITHIPYRGGAPAMADVISGQMDMYSGDVFPLMGFMQAKQLRPIAVFGDKRAPQIPEVASTAEQGYPKAEMNNWYGILAPAGLPPAVKEKIEKAWMTVLTKPEHANRLNATGITGPLNAAEFKKVLDFEYARWPALIKKMDIKEG